VIAERSHGFIPDGAGLPERTLQLTNRLHIAANYRAYFLISERCDITVRACEFFNQACPYDTRL